MSLASNLARQYVNLIYRRDFYDYGSDKWHEFDREADKIRNKAYAQGVGDEFESAVISG